MILKPHAHVDKPKSLADIFAEDDDLELLSNVKAQRPGMTQEKKEERLEDDIKKFIITHGQMPNKHSNDMAECRLARRLAAIASRNPQQATLYQRLLDEYQANPEAQQQTLSDVTTFKVPVTDLPQEQDLEKNPEQPPAEQNFNSLEDIFNDDDDLDLLSDITAETELPKESEGIKARRIAKAAEVVARTEHCRDFFKYETWFERAKQLCAQGDLVVTRYRGYSQELDAGQFYILNGILALVTATYKENTIRKNRKIAFRIKVIFDNRTQYEPFNHSFQKALNDDKNGKILIAQTAEGERFIQEVAQVFSNQENKQNSEDESSGYLYILRSLNHNLAIREFVQHSDLVKIGFCTTTVEERIRGAEKDPTYLCAPVEIICAYRCHNIDPHNFERIVHAFLWEQRFNVTLTDANGRQYQPREWFTVSAQTACDVVERILNGTIMQYRIDSVQGKLVKKK